MIHKPLINGSLSLILEDARCWFAPPHRSFKVNSDATILNGEVGIRIIVCDSIDDIMLSMENHFLMMGLVELAEGIAIF